MSENPRHRRHHNRYKFGGGAGFRVAVGVLLLVVGLIWSGIDRMGGCRGGCDTSGHVLQGAGMVLGGVAVLAIVGLFLWMIRTPKR